MSERIAIRVVGLLLSGSIGASALSGCGEKTDITPFPSPSPDNTCNVLPAVKRVEGGFVVDGCAVGLYDPKDPYNQRTANPNGVKSDQLVEDIPPGQVFGVNCLLLEDKPRRAIIPTHNSQTGEQMLGAVNLTAESSAILQGEDIPECPPGLYEHHPTTR